MLVKRTKNIKNNFQKSLSLEENYMNIILTLIIPPILASKQKQWIGLFRKNTISQQVIQYTALHLRFQK